jgi:hypothetical protein
VLTVLALQGQGVLGQLEARLLDEGRDHVLELLDRLVGGVVGKVVIAVPEGQVVILDGRHAGDQARYPAVDPMAQVEGGIGPVVGPGDALAKDGGVGLGPGEGGLHLLLGVGGVAVVWVLGHEYTALAWKGQTEHRYLAAPG